MKNEVKVLINYGIKMPNICVSCGKPNSTHTKLVTFDRQYLIHNQRFSINFPLCEKCYSIQEKKSSWLFEVVPIILIFLSFRFALNKYFDNFLLFGIIFSVISILVFSGIKRLLIKAMVGSQNYSSYTYGVGISEFKVNSGFYPDYVVFNFSNDDFAKAFSLINTQK